MSYLTTNLTKRQSRFTLFLTVFLAIVLWLSFPVSMTASPMAVGGTGPGGVGATTGLDTLELWLRSDMPVYSDTGCNTQQTTDGNPVACWRDYSGNGNHATQNNSSNQPSLVSSGANTLNNNSVLGFDGDDVLVTGNVSLDNFTILAIFRNTTFARMFYEQSPNANSDDGLYLYSSSSSTMRVYRSPLVSTKDLSPNWGDSGSYLLATQRYAGAHATHDLIINGTVQTLSSGSAGNPTGTVTREFYIGARGSSGAIGITGNYAEFIVYSEALNLAQRTIIENYLQAKYALTIANDRYDGDTGANDNFDMDVAGIGRESVSELHSEAHSVGMIVVDSGFLQDNGDYLMFGHRTPVNSNVFTELPSTGVWSTAPDPVRWERHWYIDVTDVNTNGGTVDIIFDFNEGGMGIGAPTNIPANYRLLRRSDINSDFEDLVGATSVDIPLKRVIFANVSVTDLGSNFTLGSLDGSASPTAITMQSAAATLPIFPWFIIALVLLILGVSAVMMVARGRKA